MPMDTEAERILLGSIIMGHERTAEIFEQLNEDDFFDSRHQVIFRTLKRMWQEAHPLDLAFLEGTITSAKETEAAGGIPYLASLIDGIFLRMRVDSYAERVRTKRVMRLMIHASSKIETDAWEADQTGQPASQVIDKAIELFSSIAKLAESEDRGKPNRDAAVSLLGDLSQNNFICVKTGIDEVDDRCGGFRSGEIEIITAETGVGKTFFALQIGKTACGAGHHVLYCSGEMLAEHLMARVLCSESRVEYAKIRHPESLTDKDNFELIEATSRQCKTCRILDGELSLSRIRLAARTMSSKGEIGAIIVDYDELVEVQGKDEWEQQRILVRSLKALAMELRIPVIIVSQLRKSLNDEERMHPTLQRLYGSGAKSKHASIILYVDRPYVQDLTSDETEARVFILKSRDGRMGMTQCKFNIRTFRFEKPKDFAAEGGLPYKDEP